MSELCECVRICQNVWLNIWMSDCRLNALEGWDTSECLSELSEHIWRAVWMSVWIVWTCQNVRICQNVRLNVQTSDWHLNICLNCLNASGYIKMSDWRLKCLNVLDVRIHQNVSERWDMSELLEHLNSLCTHMGRQWWDTVWKRGRIFRRLRWMAHWESTKECLQATKNLEKVKGNSKNESECFCCSFHCIPEPPFSFNLLKGCGYPSQPP